MKMLMMILMVFGLLFGCATEVPTNQDGVSLLEKGDAPELLTEIEPGANCFGAPEPTDSDDPSMAPASDLVKLLNPTASPSFECRQYRCGYCCTDVGTMCCCVSPFNCRCQQP